ncbi:MAG: MliC family protein [Spirochaetales bacterium]|nr:MliC family protein [Spirochaetales bacterium]
MKHWFFVKVILSCTLLIAVVSCINLKKDGLSLKHEISVEYKTDKGNKIIADYYKISDNSFDFVHLLFPDGKEYTLRRAVSGSGARYIDDLSVEWWTKGSSAIFSRKNDKNEFEIIYNCSEI